MTALNQSARFSFEAIGTAWGIRVQHTLTPRKLRALKTRILDRIATFDATYSRFRDDSQLMKLSRQAGEITLPEDATELFSLYRSLYESTQGKITPLIGDVMVAAGYDSSYRLRPQVNIQPAPDWDAALTVSGSTLKTTQPIVLDVGAIGKGYLVDQVGSLLRQEGIDEFFINAGGDILHSTTTNQSIRVGLEHPSDASAAIGIFELTQGSICCSAGNKRAWSDFHHIIDPHTAQSPCSMLATWVVAGTAALADGLATALHFVPAQKLQSQYTFGYVCMRADMSVVHSPDIKLELFGGGNEVR